MKTARPISPRTVSTARRIARVPRACVIVLDAVGAGELPDAAEYGDEGSDTLGNVARAVGGLDLPMLEALGFGNIEPLEGCAPQPGAPAVAGRLRRALEGQGHDDRALGADGRRHAAADPDLPARLPARRDRPVHAPDRPRRARQQAGSGTEIIQELGEEHQRTGKWIVYTSADSVFQIAAHEDTIPLEELYRLPRRARDPDRQARRRPRDRAAVHRRAGQLRADAEPPRLLARAEAAELPLADPRRRPQSTASARSATSSPAATSTSRIPTKSNIEGIQTTERLLREIDEGLVFVNLVETDMLWGHRNDPVNFHRCLQDFDRRLPDLLAALRPGDLLVLTSDHGCDPTTPSTDHSREHALLLAYVEGRNAAGRRHERRVRRRRRDGERMARRQGAAARHPGQAVRRAVSARRSRARPGRVRRRGAVRAAGGGVQGRTGADARQIALDAVAEGAPPRVLEVGCGRASSPSGSRGSSAPRSSRSTSRSGWSS